CPVKYTRVGCFDDSMVQPRPLSQLLMTDRDPTSPVYSGIPVHWGMWDVYFPKLICRCAAKAKAKGYNVFGIQHYGECWSGCGSEDTYSRDGSSSKCITYDYDNCNPQYKDCVGKNHTNFVFTLHGEQQSYLLTLFIDSLTQRVQDIYKGYSCLKCLKIVSESSSAVFIALKFTCQGQHLKKLVSRLGASRIIKAECSTPPCPVFTHHCSYPCGMSSCSISPSLPYPSICPVPLHYPELTWPASPCSPSCPSVCAPECTPFCCRTMVNRPKKAKQFPGQLASQQPEHLEAGEVIEDNVL
ncbi:unnamed protein product, partial [Porites lobata]